MSLRAFILIGLLICFKDKNFSQDYFSYGGGNYSGLNQVISNPAAGADNRLKIDVILGGLDFNFNNSWFEIKRGALKNTGKITKPIFPSSWQNLTPNVPNNLFKNFTTINSKKSRALILENRVLLPSLLFQIDSKNSIGFTWSIRQMCNLDGISQQIISLFEKELDFSVTQNNRIQNKNLTVVQMAWAEYGLTYAKVLNDKGKHFLKAGITPKLLQGLESAYLLVKDLDFLFSTKDTLSYFSTNFSFGHSANINSPLKSNQPLRDTYHRVAKPKLGLDFGIIYEWRPKYQKYFHNIDATHEALRKDLNKYKLKFGISVVDIGRIRFDKEGSHYDLNAHVSRSNFKKFTTVKNFNMFDSLVKADFSNKNETKDFAILLPTAINTQLDFSVNQFFYLNFSAHIANINKSNYYRVHNYTAFCFAPRIEHYWFDLSLPLTLNTLSANRFDFILTGLNVRLGPLCFGSNDLVPLFKGDVSALNFYAILKIAIPFKRIRDVDRDGVIDKKDNCPDIAGEYALNGCPDKDHDGVIDKIDACPNQPGLPSLRGCPDKDADGIKDGDDACPTQPGSEFYQGCPDSDNDSIIDKEDLCPNQNGLKKFKGCPDIDADEIPDKDDLCPTAKGPIKFRGCPDKDGDKIHDGIDQCIDIAGPLENKGCPWPDIDSDGIIDKLDSCVDVPGLALHKGCPAPFLIAKEEGRILEKAYSNLEFKPGSDNIKKNSYPALDELVKLMLSHKKDWKIKLSGHTDNIGNEATNLTLSEKRTKAVQVYLNRKGLPKENIIMEWFGQSQSIASNLTQTGRQKNRRVEMKILAKD